MMTEEALVTLSPSMILVSKEKTHRIGTELIVT